MMEKLYNSIDLFSGCGGLSHGLKKAGFNNLVALDIDHYANETYKLNFPDTVIIDSDIRLLTKDIIIKSINNKSIHLLAGCPPCQGFSTMRRHNRKKIQKDSRNSLMFEYSRLVKELNPYTIMMENVPGMTDYYRFKKMLYEFKTMGYQLDYEIVNVKDYGIPQNRRRFVLVGSRLGPIKIAQPTFERNTVRDTIGKLEPVCDTKDPIHKIFSTHSEQILKRIRLTPKNGGSWKDLPEEYKLECHKKRNVGFFDVYGRLRWDTISSTITGGCLNPSKGRFLHPEEDRAITAREAALLQSFPRSYKFPHKIPKSALALLIGNALPPKFSYIQSLNIKKHLDQYLT